MPAVLPSPLPGWFITTHARQRAAERGLCDRDLRQVVEQPALTYTQDQSYGVNRQVRARGEWAVVVNPVTRAVVTVLYRDRRRWLEGAGLNVMVVLADAC